MTIRRQYSLPNCKLVLEGLGDDMGGGLATTYRPSLSMIMNVECHFLGRTEPLTGGQDFLNSLVTTVSRYAQEFLSGVPHTNQQNGRVEQVQLKRISEDLHRLLFYPQPSQSAHTSAEPVQVDLKTVQLFDLVEAVDQLCADAQTLPDLSLKLQPVPRRHTVSQEPVAKRVVPASIGISGLAVAAGLLFLIPVPEFRRPEPAGETTETTQPSPASADASPAGSPPPDTDSSSSTGSPTPDVETSAVTAPDGDSSPADESPATEIEGSTPAPAATASPSSADAEEEAVGDRSLDNLVASAPAITNPDELTQLTRTLRNKLVGAWDSRPAFEEELVYRVGVSAQGDILGFDYENDAAIAHRQEVPLTDLLYIPTDAAGQEPIAEFRVVFTPEGVIQVSPWHGKPPAAGAEN